jgi:hypothetical protein
MLLGLTNSYSQYVYVNPGIKLGYMFGEKGGFVLGIEISVTYVDLNHAIVGLVFDYDELSKFNKIHLGFEASTLFAGIDVGPTFGWDDDNNYTGFSIIPFGGAFIYPYYNYTFFNKNMSYHEIGSYIKVTIPNKSTSINLSGG